MWFFITLHYCYFKFLGSVIVFSSAKKLDTKAAKNTTSSESRYGNSASEPTTAMTNNPQLLQDPESVPSRFSLASCFNNMCSYQNLTN